MRRVKRLTLNRIAGANLRINRKAYISLFTGILLAVYLTTATSLCTWGTVRGHEEQMAEKVGWMDMILAAGCSATDEELRATGYFREIGHVTVNATVEGGEICTGWYDETAEKLMNRRLKEGRMPEQAGEIAAERSALIRLDLGSATVGEPLTLTLKPVGGVSETRTYTLVGILNEQTDNLETYAAEEGAHLPAMLVSPEETFAVGTAAVNRVVTYAPLITYNQVMRHIPMGLEYAVGVSREDGRTVFYDSGWDRARTLLNRIVVWLVLGAALLLSVCVGITSAMESVLAQKTQDIGMLRAIGATRRQIRRVYGAEAWLLTATALPAGLALGTLTALLISRIAPDQVAFSLTPWLLIPILLLSALCVFAASRLPLYRASRQMPMGVLRDTAMLRKSGRMHSRSVFVPARLIAGRRAGLHPMRMLGAAGMTALTLVCALLLGELALGLNLRQEDPAAFRITGPGFAPADVFSQTVIPEDTLSRTDMHRIENIEGVSGIRSTTEITANLLTDGAPDYFRTYQCQVEYEDGAVGLNTVSTVDYVLGYTTDWLYYSAEDLADARARQEEDWNAAGCVLCAEQSEIIRSRLGITETVIPVSVYVVDTDLETLREFVTDGEIDADRLDSGEEALVYAPAVCMRKAGHGTEINKWLMPGQIRDEEWDLVVRNDVFTAGMPLRMLEIAGSRRMGMEWEATADQSWNEYYETAEAVYVNVSVGAVLSGPAEINGWTLTGFTVILTEKGAQALGLKLPNPDETEVFVSGNPSPAEEEQMADEIRQIVARGWMDVENRLQLSREYTNRKLREILLFSGMILLFFAVSVFMQVSGASRQIRSDTRTIGTLRAVGADLKTLVGCYRLPAWICAGAALVPPLLFYLFCAVTGQRLFTAQHPLLILPILAVMAACIALACTAGIRRRLAAVSRQSIVENIREL